MKLARRVAMGLSLIVIFTVSFWIMWNQRKADAPPENTSAGSVIGQSNPAPAPMAAAAGTAAVSPDDRSPAAPDSVAAPATASGSPQDSAAAELPVELHFRQRPDQGKIQGSVVNNSGDELVIDAIVFSPSTRETAKFQLTVAPYSGKPFGLDDGLNLQPGDQITLKSSPYRDKLGRIP